jgi:serine/threonine protein kinase
MVKKSDTDDDATRRNEPAPVEPSQQPSAAAHAPDPPARLRDQFMLQEKLGDGGMGAVYKALDLQRSKYEDPNSFVALKVIKPEVLRDFPDAALALQREASRAMELSHPNIVRIYGFYDLDPADGTCFITMELLKGRPLDSLLRNHPRGLPARHALFLLEQICAGLQYAHDRRLVHSDLKPGNIFITDDGVVRILDFGIATPLRSLNDARAETRYNPRQYGALTPAYASLEQWARMSADPRDDLYSLGCIAYEMLAGEHPFAHADARRACNDGMPVRPIRKLSSHQNKALRRALSFRRQDRTATVEQFYQELSEPARTPFLRLALLGAVVAAVVFVAANLWTARERSASGTEPASLGSEPRASVATTALPSAAAVAPQALDERQQFEKRCGMPASERALQQLLDSGLQDSADLSLQELPESELKTVTDRVAATAECIVALRRMNIQSVQSEQWLKDVESILRR